MASVPPTPWLLMDLLITAERSGKQREQEPAQEEGAVKTQLLLPRPAVNRRVFLAPPSGAMTIRQVMPVSAKASPAVTGLVSPLTSMTVVSARKTAFTRIAAENSRNVLLPRPRPRQPWQPSMHGQNSLAMTSPVLRLLAVPPTLPPRPCD